MVLRTQRYTGRVAQEFSSSRARFAASQLKPVLKGLLIPAIVLAPFALTFACGGNASAPGLDNDKNRLADDLGKFVDANHDGIVDSIDINGDGRPDGPAVDTNGDGVADALALDTNCDKLFDSLDTNGDGLPNVQTSRQKIIIPATCHDPNPVTGATAGGGGAPGVGGAPQAMGGSVSHGGSPGTAGGPTTAGSGGAASTSNQLGKGSYQGSGESTDRYAEQDVYRDGVGYKFIANGWGDNWQSHDILWKGTSFTLKSFAGAQGSKSSPYAPAGYPSMFCGLYSQKQSDDCGLPITISAAKSIKTGWRWQANGNTGQYNAAWDIWLGNNGTLASYLMVWLRDPPGQQPAGNAQLAGVTIPNVPGTWSIYKGTVNNLPIVNYVQAEGKDLSELEFNVLDVYNDAIKRNYSLPGSQILAVAIGYEIWNGPVANLVTEDFYVDVK
jgi:glycosyl hydrolase family 12